MTIVAFEKEVSLKASASLAFNDSSRVLKFILDKKKTCNIYKWKEKVQKNTGRRRKVQVTKASFEGLHRFVFFTAESLPCSETQLSKWSFYKGLRYMISSITMKEITF